MGSLAARNKIGQNHPLSVSGLATRSTLVTARNGPLAARNTWATARNGFPRFHKSLSRDLTARNTWVTARNQFPDFTTLFYSSVFSLLRPVRDGLRPATPSGFWYSVWFWFVRLSRFDSVTIPHYSIIYHTILDL